MTTPLHIRDVPVGRGAPLVLIAGLNVIESEAAAVACAETLVDLAARHRLPLVFKASFDKANRSDLHAFRGPGLEIGLSVLEAVKQKTGLPVLTDVHDPAQADIAARVVDCIQIPAFLCRQTDLLLACAQTGLPINIKKGQFVAPADIQLAVAKILAPENSGGAMLTERGTSFGHNDLVVDMRGLLPMRDFAPLCFDATHAAQYPGAGDNASGGDRRFVAPLARAATAIGIDALFVEIHPNPDSAPCDARCQLDFESLDRLLTEVVAIDTAVRASGS
jgi:2-dehydro-3-deoxyphosphooctonate aldolase (KDO 8-P synthase)